MMNRDSCIARTRSIGGSGYNTSARHQARQDADLSVRGSQYSERCAFDLDTRNAERIGK